MAFIAVVLFIAALLAFVGFKGSYLLLNALEPKNKPLNKTIKLLIALGIAAAAVIIWITTD